MGDFTRLQRMLASTLALMNATPPYALPVGGGDTPLGRWLWEQHVANVEAANAARVAEGVCVGRGLSHVDPAEVLWHSAGSTPNILPLCTPCYGAWKAAIEEGGSAPSKIEVIGADGSQP